MVSQEDLRRAEELHGHLCPFLVIGMRAAEIAMERLRLSRLGAYESIHEEIVAIVEVNNCFADGVQVKTGCTLGNNSLIYVDLGKNAVTLVKRDSGEAVRVYLDAEKITSIIPAEARELRRRVLVERTATRDEVERFAQIWRKISLEVKDLPESFFQIREFKIRRLPEKSPIYESIKCSLCGEYAMATRVVYKDGRPLCLACAESKTPAVVGRGIVVDFDPRIIRGD